MWQVLILLLVGVSSLWGQFRVTPAQMPDIEQVFSKQDNEKPLSCHVVRFRPSVSFSFRIQSGYYADFPLRQFAGSRGRMVVLMRVVPDAAEEMKYYFAQTNDLPEIPEGTKAMGELSGGLYFGEGKYTVDWVATDLQNHFCRKRWRVDARWTGKEKQLKVVQKPGSVEPIVLPQWSRPPLQADAPPRRATIFLNVAPLRPRALRLSVFDRSLMFGTLKAVLEQSGFSSVRMVAFNLDRHKEVFRRDRLDESGFNELRKAIQDLSLSTIDLSALKDPRGHLSLLTRLVQEALETSSPADAVIFIGPNTRRFDKLPEDWPAAPSSTPRFFYFEYSLFPGTFPDVITRTVRSFDGKWYPVHSPHELAAALQKMERELAAAPPATVN